MENLEEKIKKFEGRYRFLSNFWISPIVYMGKTYSTVEHLFQAMKADNERDHEKIRTLSIPIKAKQMGRRIKLRSDWESIKDKMMYHAVLCKFMQHKDLADNLLLTGDAYLEEGNSWGDTYWGMCNGEGKNHLGLILMMVRDEIKMKGGSGHEEISRQMKPKNILEFLKFYFTK